MLSKIKIYGEPRPQDTGLLGRVRNLDEKLKAIAQDFVPKKTFDRVVTELVKTRFRTYAQIHNTTKNNSKTRYR